MTRWEITLAYPTLPLSLNDRRHRMVIWRAQRDLRDRVRWATRHAGIPRLHAIHVEMHWTPRTVRRRDADNAVATLKSALDGTRDYPATYRYINGRKVLTTAAWVGIVPDDTPEHVTWTPPIIHPADPDPFYTERLRLVIEDRSKT